MALTILCIVFTLCLLLGVPVAFSIGISAVATILYEGLPLAVVFQRMTSGMNIFSFLAIPFFIFAGELMDLCVEVAIDFARAQIEAGCPALWDYLEPRLQAGRTGDLERLRAARHELGLQQQERQSSEMIAMQMRHQHRRDPVGVDSPLADRHHRRGAAIDQEVDALARDVEAGVQPSARADRVAAADKSQLHCLAPSSGSVDVPRRQLSKPPT